MLRRRASNASAPRLPSIFLKSSPAAIQLDRQVKERSKEQLYVRSSTPSHAQYMLSSEKRVYCGGSLSYSPSYSQRATHFMALSPGRSLLCYSSYRSLHAVRCYSLRASSLKADARLLPSALGHRKSTLGVCTVTSLHTMCTQSSCSPVLSRMPAVSNGKSADRSSSVLICARSIDFDDSFRCMQSE